MSFHLGLGSYGRGDYVVQPPPVRTAEADARALAALAEAEGFTATALLGPAASRDAIHRAFDEAATLGAGGALVITMSGHGVQIPDTAPRTDRPRPPSAANRVVGDEPDGLDEAWCLYDGFLVDDELGDLLLGLAAGVRVLIVSDTCHSGTMLPEPASDRGRRIRASVLHLAACTDAGCAFNGDHHGVFTGALLALWQDGFAGSHLALRDALAPRTHPLQRPVLTRTGAHDIAFLAERPFTRPRRRLPARSP